LGQDRDKELPIVGAVHLAAGFLTSAMLGCKVEFKEDSAPQVLCAQLERPEIDPEQAFRSKSFKKFQSLLEDLKTKKGYVTGDVDWNGILNIAIDLRGENIFMDLFDKPEQVKKFFTDIAQVISRFAIGVKKETGTSSIAVNRNLRNIPAPVYLHSECSNTMISVEDYEKYLLAFDIEWSKKYRPFGIHYCGGDPHRYAESFTQIPNLDFLDVGWGGDIEILRKHLPGTFLNIRLSPVEIINQGVDEIRDIIRRLVEKSGNPLLTGVCCINMDHQVSDKKISAIFETVDILRKEYQEEEKYT